LEITVKLLDELFRYRWTAPILAELWSSQGCKYVTLRHRLGVADCPLRQALDAAIAGGLVIRNPGYGHPSRPEYLVVEGAEPIARRCGATVEALERLGVLRIGLNRWSMPVLFRLSRGADRFGEIRAGDAPISPRALARALRDLIDAGLVARSVSAAIPVCVEYRLSEQGRWLAAIWT
jgi:DNA-binding HxlR family transcriptional regulator